MHRLYDFRINLNKFTTKVTRNRAMTSGSGIKMRAQKKTGKARMGDKRAPHLKKGGKAHGAKAKIFSYHLNAKIKLAGLKALLSAKLVEGKVRIVTS
jgi:large subunit ribosomal protein L4